MTGQELVAPELRNWADATVARIGQKVPERARTSRRRKLLMVHLDGVPRAVIDDAIATNKMPFLASMVRSGAFNLDGAFWGSPASTPCFQAGALYGVRHPNLPAYSWYDRALGRNVRMNAPADALEMEGRLAKMANGSLLEDGGTAYLALFRAQAENRLCMSSLANVRDSAKHLFKDLRGLRQTSDRPVLDYLWGLLGESLEAKKEVQTWAERVRDWRHEKEYLMNRFFMINLAWGLAHTRTLIDMVRGVPAIYLVFGNYDEVAHRRGPTSQQALAELYGADARLAELHAIAKALPEPYDLVFFTDHGHVDSAPFEQRRGKRLEKYLFEKGVTPLDPAIERALLDGRTPVSPIADMHHDAVVAEAGNFGHIYLGGPKALEAREILAWHKTVLARCASHPDIGITCLRHGDSAVAIINGKVYKPDEIESAELAQEFNKRAVADLLRELPHMPTAGDLVLYGEAHKKAGTVGFAWEFGSHGGLTKTETNSVVIWPSDAGLDLSGLGHVVQLHERLSEAYRN